MKFNREKADAAHGLKKMIQRNATDSQSDRPSHHSQETKRGRPMGSFAKLEPMPTAPRRRRPEGDIVYPSERQGGGAGMGVPPGMRSHYVPQELIKATIKPMGVPLATDMVSAEIHDATGNELIINRLEEIEEGKGPGRVWAKVNKYTTYALRGFGSFDVAMGRGLFSLELQKSLRRQANTLNRRLRELKIRVPLTNRSINGIALLSWGAEDGRVGRKNTILPNDCFHLDSAAFGKFKLTDEKVEEHGRRPATMYMFIKMARRQSRLYAAMYGEEHLGDRLQAIERSRDIHEDWPEFSTASLVAETWERAMYQYNISFAEGVHYITGEYDEGITFGKLQRFALTPGIDGGAAWRYAPVFDFDIAEAFWKMAALPGIQKERQRQGIQTLAAARVRSGEHPGWEREERREEKK